MEPLVFNLQKFCLHDGPGIRTTIFFKGCNLRCKWCANPESQSFLHETMNGAPVGRAYTIDALVLDALKDKSFYDRSGGGVTLSGGEPLLHPDYVCALSDALHAADVSVGVESAGCVPPETFQRVMEKLDFALLDIKHWDSEKHADGTGVGNALILENLRWAIRRGLAVTPRIPIIPGYNDAPEDARAFSALLPTLGASTVQLLPFHQLGEKKYQTLDKPYAYAGQAQLHDEDLADYAQILSAAGLTVQIGG